MVNNVMPRLLPTLRLLPVPPWLSPLTHGPLLDARQLALNLVAHQVDCSVEGIGLVSRGQG
jgi:hypothetical protein